MKADRMLLPRDETAEEINARIYKERAQVNGKAGLAKPGHNAPEGPQLRIRSPFEDRPILKRPEMWEGVLHDNANILLVGGYGTGKSGLGQVLSVHVGSGTALCGRAVKQGAVVIIAGEGADGIDLRIRAAAIRSGIDPKTCRVWIIDDYLDLVHGEQYLAALIDTIAENVREPIALLCVDTAATVMGGEDEDNRWFGKLNIAMRRLRERFECASMVTHHHGKDSTKGARGGTSLPANVDTRLDTSLEGDLLTVIDGKQRDRPTGKNKLVFRIEGHDIETADGRTENVPVVVWAEGVEPPKAKKVTRTPTGQKGVAYQAAIDVCNEDKIPAPRGREYVTGSTEERWRALCRKRGLSGSTSDDAFRNAFKRSKDGLVSGGWVCIDEGFVWVPTNHRPSRA